MKNIKKTVLLLFTLILLIGITACSNSEAASSQEDQAAIQEATDQQATAEQVIPKADPEASVDVLIGDWINVDLDSQFAKITKTDAGYQYEDNEGKYTATFQAGVLTVNVSDMETAEVYFDGNTQHMVSVYQGSTSEFIKK